MTAPESALDIAREVCPGLKWDDEAVGMPPRPEASAMVCGVVLTLWRDDEWHALADIGEELGRARGPDPRACLRAVLAEVHAWAVGVAEATKPPDTRDDDEKARDALDEAADLVSFAVLRAVSETTQERAMAASRTLTPSDW